MGILEGKKGLVIGVANQKSIAWGVSQACHDQGAELAFTYLNESLEKRVRPLAESVGSKLILPCDVQSDEDIAKLFATVKEEWGGLDFVVHSVAFAHGDDLKNGVSETSRDGFKLALDVSAYSLIAVTKHAKDLMPNGGSILTMTYLGAVQVVPNYRLMGVAKAALEAAVRELAVELGQSKIRVNAISAGPIRTLAASGIAQFKQLISHFEDRAPMRQLVTIEEVGNSAAYLLSDLSSAVTGEIHYVDGGFNITAA